jgi:hypothetical protein
VSIKANVDWRLTVSTMGIELRVFWAQSLHLYICLQVHTIAVITAHAGCTASYGAEA